MNTPRLINTRLIFNNNINFQKNMKKNLITALSAAAVSFGFIANACAVEPCKFYFKAEGAYTIGLKNKMSTNAGSNTNSVSTATAAAPFFAAGNQNDVQPKDPKYQLGGSFGGGIGYNITDALRTDLTVRYITSNAKTKKSLTSLEKEPWYVKRSGVEALVNITYDFNNSSPFTPFITGGIGMNNTKTNFVFNNYGDVAQSKVVLANAASVAAYKNAINGFKGSSSSIANDVSSIKRKTSFAYQAGAGVAYEISQGVYIDVAYKLSGIPKSGAIEDFRVTYVTNGTGQNTGADAANALGGTTTTATTGVQTKQTLQHNIVAGLRVEF